MEGHLIADELAWNWHSCSGSLSFSSRRRWNCKNLSFTTPGVLTKKGVKVAIMTDHPVIPIQYLPVCAALRYVKGWRKMML